MIFWIDIHYFRSCVNIRIDDIDPMIVLAGKNGVGKSNTLQAINWLARVATSMTAGSYPAQLDRGGLFGSVEIGFEVDGRSYRYFASLAPLSDEIMAESLENEDAILFREKLTLQADDGDQSIIDRIGREITLFGGREVNIPNLAGSLPALLSLLSPDDALVEHVNNVVRFLKGIHYYTFDESDDSADQTSLVSSGRYRAWLAKRGMSEQTPKESVVLRLLHMHLEDPDSFHELKELVGPNGLNLLSDILIITHPVKVHTPPDPNKDRAYYFINFAPSNCEGNEDSLFEFSQLSFGTRRVLRILVSLLFDKSTLVLGEHPEDGIHSGLTKKLISLLQRYAPPGQLIISSHSLVVFNTLQPRDVRLVTMEEGRTSIRKLSRNELTLAAKFISDEGTLADVIESIEN